MRTAILGALVVAGLVVTAAGVTANPGEGFPQPIAQGRSSQAAGQLIALSTCVGDKYQQVTVIDPKTEAMSVYPVSTLVNNARVDEARCITPLADPA